MSLYANRRFWTDAIDRAIQAAAQAPLLAWGVGDVGTNAFDLDWELGVGFAAGGALLSLLSSIASARVGDPGTPQAVGKDGGLLEDLLSS